MRELRTRTSRTIRNADGTYTTTLGTAPLNYLDAAGSWQPIDSDWVPATDAADTAAGYALRNGGNAFRALVKPELTDGFMCVDLGTRAFTLTLLDAGAVATGAGEAPGSANPITDALGRAVRALTGGAAPTAAATATATTASAVTTTPTVGAAAIAANETATPAPGGDATLFSGPSAAATAAAAAGLRKPAQARGSRVAFANAFRGVDLEYDLTADAVKETLVLADAGAPVSYRFALVPTRKGTLEAVRREDGAWAFLSAPATEPLFVLEAPYAVDTAGASTLAGADGTDGAAAPAGGSPAELGAPPSATAAAPGAATPAIPGDAASWGASRAAMTVTPVGDHFVVEVALDPLWLRDAARVFPVYLDPTISIQPPTEDANFKGNNNNALPTGDARLKIGSDATTHYRPALRFDLAGIPAGVTVSDAQLKLFYDGTCVTTATSCGTVTHQVSAHRITGNWTMSTKTTNLPFDSLNPLSTYTLPATLADTWMSWSVTTAVNNWRGGAWPNYGILLKRSTEALNSNGPTAPGRRYTADASIKPRIEVTWTGDGVQLEDPDTLHSNGADLKWARYAGGAAFDKYEIHRSETADFAPSGATLLTTIKDAAITSYRDTTAAPNKTFSYKVVANASVSNERRVALPALDAQGRGQATKLLQPGLGSGKATHVQYDSAAVHCGNYGASTQMTVGTGSTTRMRGLLAFDLRDVPSGVTISAAMLSLWHPEKVNFAATASVHRVTAGWNEGTGTGACTGDGATWHETQGGVKWKTAGGDYHPTAAASVAVVSGETEKWHAFTVTSLVRDWVTAKAPNHGVLVKLDDATLTANRAFAYLSDDYTVEPALRPKLAVTYVDNSTPQGPSVSVAAPGAGSKIGGSAVAVSAAVGDDRRVEKVEFFAGSAPIGTDTAAPWQVSWNTTALSNGQHSLSAKAHDDAGNVTTSAVLGVTVENSAPPTTSLAGLAHPPTDTWRGHYYANKDLSGEPALVRDDAAIAFDWGWGSPGSPILADGYSVRWVRSVNFDGSCVALYTRSDDGIRVFVDGVQALSYWENRAATSKYDEVCPSAGAHTVTVEYYEDTIEAEAHFDILTTVPATSGGWWTEYYANASLSGSPAVSRLEPAVSFEWGTASPAAGVPVDGWSARFVRSAYFDGTCLKFHTKSDDGVRVLIDGREVLSHWSVQSGTDRWDTACPSAGEHTVYVEYYDDNGAASLYFDVVASVTTPATAWRAEYFGDRYLTPPAAKTRMEPAIAFDWGSGSPDPTISADNFSARWVRTMLFDGTCQKFHTRSDDGIRVFIDGVQVLSYWMDQGFADRWDTVCPTAGAHEVKVEYYENAGGAGAYFDMVATEWLPSDSWRGYYYPNTTLSGSPTLVRSDAAIAFDWVSGSPDASLPADAFSVRWVRSKDFDGTCQAFSTSTDDGVRVFLDGALALDYWSTGGPDRTDVLCPSAGWHTMTVEYFEGGGLAKAYVGVAPASAPVAASAAPTYYERVVGDSPTAYWRLGELGGRYFFGFNAFYTGTVTGTVALGAAGAFPADPDAAATFDGSTGFASVEDWPDLSPAAITLESWVYLTAYPSSPGNMISKANNTGYRYRVNPDGSASFLDRGAANALSTPAGAVPLNRWAHVVATGDAAGLKLYVDGVLKASNTTPYGGPGTTGEPLHIGATPAFGEYFRGALDEVAVYGRALSAAQIQAHHDAGTAVRGTVLVSASAGDDGGVTRVEFYVDELRYAEVAAAPYRALWNSLDPAVPAFDGQHALTTRAYDASGQVTVSAPVTVTVANRAATKYPATIAAADVPAALTFDPATATQLQHGVDVTLTNNSVVAWAASGVRLHYRWLSPDSPPAVADGPPVSLGTDLPAGQSRTVRVMIEPPALPQGTDRGLYRLQFDLHDAATNAWFGAKGNPPSEHPVLVNKMLKTKLGLEPYYRYATESLGAGMTHLVNVANGNSLLTWTPFAAPGRGPGTAVSLTYNSLEKKSESPVGAGWSLVLSGLTRLGQPLDIHPNNADTISGRSNRWVEFTDADGTTHRFEGELHGDGTVFWKEPAGVHLYLRQYSTTDATRKWALTTPGRTTFFYDAEGYPTFVEDNNGNRLAFTLETTPPGEDPGGPKKRVTKVTDAAGLNADGTVNPAVTTRSFSIAYYAKAEAKKAHVRGKVKRLTDHDGSALDFEYYDDGNLRKLIQRGGTSAEGGFLADRQFVFTYTTSSGDEAALPNAADRIDPDPGERNQSHQLYSVRDPRGAETLFAYHGPPTSQNRWKLAARTDRAGQVTSFDYDITNRVTTITAPLARVTKHTYDADGKVTKTTNALQQDTLFDWNADFRVTKVTEPTGKFVEMTYDANGAVTSSKNQLGQTTTFEYQYVQADANDVSGKWKAGRTHAHIGQLIKQTDPKGVLTATPVDDFQRQFVYDTRGNLTESSDSEQRKLAKKTVYAYNADGTLLSVTDPNNRVTQLLDYDANGFATRVVDAAGGTTRRAFSDDGLLLWTQDAAHAADSGTDVRSYRTYVDYDRFHRPVRTSAPKSTLHDRGMLIWSGTTYDANGNPVARTQPHESRDGFLASKPATAVAFDAMDRSTLVTGPDRSIDPAGERTQFVYDAAGRMTRTVGPKGMLTTTPTWDFATDVTYDALDRVTKQVQYETGGAEQRTFSCFDTAGDLRTVTSPRANISSIDCAAAIAGTSVPAHTTRYAYDDAHRRLTTSQMVGVIEKRETLTYDANGNVSTRAASPTTSFNYDEANRLVEIKQPYVVAGGVTTRELVTRYEYDAAGNQMRVVSPRAYDANPGLSNYAGQPYVTTVTYDANDQVERVELPSESPTAQKHYIHRKYDRLGRLQWTSQPTTESNRTTLEQWELANPSRPTTGVSPLTEVVYWDRALIPGDEVRLLADQNYPVVFFDVKETATAIERWRIPLDAGERAPNFNDRNYDERYASIWRHSKESGRLMEYATGRGIGEKRNLISYDGSGQVEYARIAVGQTSTDESPMSVWIKYDDRGRPEAIRHKKDNQTDCRVSTLAYKSGTDLVEQRYEDGTAAYDAAANWCPASAAAPGAQRTFGYDDLNRLKTETAPGHQITLGYHDDTGFLKERVVANGAGQQQLRTAWEYFANGQPRTQLTERVNGSTTVFEKHELSYDDPAAPGEYVGFRTQDRFGLRGPDVTAKCYLSDPGTLPCTQTNQYDARGRLVGAALKQGAESVFDATYTLDPAGNLTSETLVQAVKGTTSRTFAYDTQTIGTNTFHGRGNQLLATTTTLPGEPTKTERYLYDFRDRLDCITSDAFTGTGCPASPPDGQSAPAGLGVDYQYDEFDRLESFRIFGAAGEVTNKSQSVYDVLSRMTSETESHISPTHQVNRRTVYSYLGLSQAIKGEEHFIENTGLTTHRNKTYGLDGLGQRVSMDNAPDAPTTADPSGRFFYAYNEHAGVSLLLSENGPAKSSYAYTPYGEHEPAVSRGDWIPQAPGALDLTNPYLHDPFNAFRYTSKRLDTGNGGLNMGARFFSHDYKRFYQRDYFEEQGPDLALSLDPWNLNRYALAAGSPEGFVEVGGHYSYPKGITRAMALYAVPSLSSVATAVSTRAAAGAALAARAVGAVGVAVDLALFLAFPPRSEAPGHPTILGTETLPIQAPMPLPIPPETLPDPSRPKMILLRGVSDPAIDPRDIFRTGFYPKGYDFSIVSHVLRSPESFYVGASPSMESALRFATDHGKQPSGGHVYEIHTNRAISVAFVLLMLGEDDLLEGFEHEHELAIPGGVPPWEIRGAWKVVNGQPQDPFIMNEFFRG